MDLSGFRREFLCRWFLVWFLLFRRGFGHFLIYWYKDGEEEEE